MPVKYLTPVADHLGTRLYATATPIEWNAELPIYASEQFLRSESDEYGWIGGLDEERRIRCVLPYVVLYRAGIRLVRFRTGTIVLGRELEPFEERSFLHGALEYCRSIRADIIIPSGNHAIFRTYPQAAAVAPYATLINDLTLSEDALLSAIRKSFRQNIRKAVSAGIQIKQGVEYLDISYNIIAETLKRSKESFKPYDEFKAKIGSFGEFVRIFVAEHGGVIQGCMVAPFSQHTAYNCYAGSTVQPKLGAMHLLHWEAMKHFRAIGVKQFDFQGVRVNPEKGSKQEGIMHYKQGFGGKFVEGYLWKYKLNPVKSVVYSLGIRWLKGGDIVDHESKKRITA